MNENTVHLLEELFQRKIILYNDLLLCLEKERESLIAINLDALWAISKEKEEMCSKIECIRQEIASVVGIDVEEKPLTLNQIFESIPEKQLATFQRFTLTLLKLKSEIELLRNENMVFINDSLQFLDEMISIITGETESKIMYNDRCHISKSGINCFLSREA